MPDREFDPGPPGSGRRAREVVRILDTLDRVEGDALRLIYFSGLSQEQVARVLGLPRTIIGRSVARGMRELARRLRDAAP